MLSRDRGGGGRFSFWPRSASNFNNSGNAQNPIMSLPLHRYKLFSAHWRSPDSPPLTRAPLARLAPIIPAPELPLADSRLRTSFNPDPLPTATDTPSSPPWKSHIPGWRRDFDDPLLPPPRFPSSQGITRLSGAWNVRDNADQGSIMNKFRPGIRSFIFIFFSFLFFSLSLCHCGSVFA